MNKLISNFAGGMNQKVSPLIIKDSECELILNYNLDLVGAITKRNGYTVFGNQPVAAKTILGLYQFNDSSGSESNPLMVANISGDATSVIYEYVSGTGNWTSRNTAGTASKKTRFATFIDYVFRVNSSDTVLSSADLSAWGTTDCPTTITPSFIANYEDRVYVANGGTTTGSRVWYSSLPTGAAPFTITWTTTVDYLDVNPDDGDSITALENNGNKLLIFKNRSMYRWSFGQIEPDRLIGVGTSSQECVKTNLDIGITFFANANGVYSYMGDRPKLISRKIEKWFKGLVSTDITGFSAEIDSDHYYLYLGDSLTVGSRTYTNVMAVYTISLDAWVIYTLNAPIRIMSRLIQSGVEQIYFGSTNGRTYLWDSGTSDNSGGASSNTATPIAGEIISKEYLVSFPTKSNLKNVDIISSQQGAAQVFINIDRQDEFYSLGELTKRMNTFPSTPELQTIRLKVSDNSTVTSVIEGINFEYEPSQKR
jgi:hypothetical protein